MTRVRRGDVDMVAAPGLVLELGDRVRVVAPPERMAEIAAFFGDSYRELRELDVLSFSVGVALGLLRRGDRRPAARRRRASRSASPAAR